MHRAIPAVAAAAALTLPSTATADPLDLRFAGAPTVAAQMAAERQQQVHRQLVARYEAMTGERRRGWSAKRLRSSIRAERAERRRQRAYERVAVPPVLASIAACESGGNPAAIGGGGLYRGKYQFDLQTWASVGGTGDPAAAPEAEQDMRAAMLYARAGAAPWPVCGA